MSQETTITEEAAAGSTPGDEEGAKSAEEVREDDSTRIVIANGQDINKRYYHEVTKKMARDWDLRKLAYLGPPLWTLAIIVLLIWFFSSVTRITSFLGATYGYIVSPNPQLIINTVLQTIYQNSLEVVIGTVTVLFLIAVLSGPIEEILSGYKSGYEEFAGGLGAVASVVKPEVWQKSNYWNPFTSHLSDRDPLVALASGTDASVSGIYGDEPHYMNVFIDSIYISVDGDLGLRQRLLTTLYNYQWRWVRRLTVIALASVLVLARVELLQIGFALTTLVTIALALTVILLALTHYPSFFVKFLAQTAGLSRYKRLLNEPKSEEGKPRWNDDGRVGLSNSMSGYGLLFISEFLYSLFSYVRYDIAVDDSLLADKTEGGESSTETEDGEGGDGNKNHGTEETKSDDETEELLAGYGEKTDNHAVAAARELLWSAIPRDSVVGSETEADITITITGVDYYGEEDRKYKVRNRIANRISEAPFEQKESNDAEGNEAENNADENEAENNADENEAEAENNVDENEAENNASEHWSRITDILARLVADIPNEEDDEDDKQVETEQILTKHHAGDRAGFRLPVKKFMSIPHGFPVDEIQTPPDEDPDLYRFTDPEEDLHWDEETVHYVLLGGGEHQQGIAKHVISMKAAGYENVDLLENAFLNVTRESDDSQTIFGRASSWVSNSKQPGPATETEEWEDMALFPTEYFVSGVFGGEDFFRQHANSFLLFSHKPEVETDTEFEQDVIIHTIIGMSAVGTKVGFLYWLDQYDSGFPEIDPDTAYSIKHAGATGFDGVDDIGHLYLNADWRKMESSPADFDRTEIDPETDEPIESDTGGTENDDSTESDSETGPVDWSSDATRLNFKYYDLDLKYDSDSP